jgi:hypothetical protein
MKLLGVHGKNSLHKLSASLLNLDTLKIWDEEDSQDVTFLGLRSFSNLKELEVDYVSTNICPFTPAPDWTRLRIFKGGNILRYESWRTAIAELPCLQTIEDSFCESEISMRNFFCKCVGKAIASSLHVIKIIFYEGNEDNEESERDANIEEGLRLLFDTFVNATSIGIEYSSFAFRDIETAKALGRLQQLHTLCIIHNHMFYVGDLAPTKTWTATMIPHFPKSLVDVNFSYFKWPDELQEIPWEVKDWVEQSIIDALPDVLFLNCSPLQNWAQTESNTDDESVDNNEADEHGESDSYVSDNEPHFILDSIGSNIVMWERMWINGESDSSVLDNHEANESKVIMWERMWTSKIKCYE